MKTLNLKQYLVLFAAIFSLTSCLKSEDPDFQIVAAGCVKQEVTKIPGVDDAEATYTSKFTPYILAQAYNYEQIANCVVSGGTTMVMGKIDTYGYQWKTTIVQASSDFPNATYTITAANADGEQSQASVTFSSSSQTMKNKLEGSVKYGSDKLTFDLNKVENATSYLVVARSSSDALFYEFIVIQEFSESQVATGLSLDKSSINSKITQAGNYQLTTVAVISSSSSNLVYQVNDEYALYTRE